MSGNHSKACKILFRNPITILHLDTESGVVVLRVNLHAGYSALRLDWKTGLWYKCAQPQDLDVMSMPCIYQGELRLHFSVCVLPCDNYVTFVSHFNCSYTTSFCLLWPFCNSVSALYTINWMYICIHACALEITKQQLNVSNIHLCNWNNKRFCSKHNLSCIKPLSEWLHTVCSMKREVKVTYHPI